jgi:hypothetical protein
MAVLLSVSLFVLGCGEDSDNGGGSQPPDPTEELKRAVSDAFGSNASVSDDGKTITVNAGTTLTQEFKVPKGATLSVGESLAVLVEGSLSVLGSISVSGTLTLADGADVTGAGTIAVVGPSGTVVSKKKRTDADESYTFGGLTEGSVEIAAGGTFKVNASTSSSDDIRTLVGKSDDGIAFLKLSDNGKVTLDATGTVNTITVAGDVTLASPNIGGSDKTLQIFEGEKLVVAESATLTLTGSLNTVEWGGTIEIKDSGKLEINADKHITLSAANLSAMTTGRIVVKKDGAILRVYTAPGVNKHLISTQASAVEGLESSTSRSRFVWAANGMGSADFVVDLKNKKIYTGSAGFLLDFTRPALTDLGFESGYWTEESP